MVSVFCFTLFHRRQSINTRGIVSSLGRFFCYILFTSVAHNNENMKSSSLIRSRPRTYTAQVLLFTSPLASGLPLGTWQWTSPCCLIRKAPLFLFQGLRAVSIMSAVHISSGWTVTIQTQMYMLKLL